MAIGDCSTIDGYALPATAQVASQQGSYLGRLFSKVGPALSATPLLRSVRVQYCSAISGTDDATLLPGGQVGRSTAGARGVPWYLAVNA
eukprot:1491844-Rhodomonas_salina.1